MPNLKTLYFGARESIRLNPAVGSAIYLAQSLKYSNTGEFRALVSQAARVSSRGTGVALCCRIRDEGRYLDEFIRYYLAAGIRHLFFYEKLSRDNYRDALAPYMREGLVTLCADWPHVPVSPAAEQNCILRSLGRFEWVGFIDADEFVVVKNGRSIGEFLAGYPDSPAVALHWYMYGSNGHRVRPEGPVIAEYVAREPYPNRHVKCFVRPEKVTAYRNPHSWYYRGLRCAVNELGENVRGSFSVPPTAIHAWINHYHHKSDQDYFEKAARGTVADKTTMKFWNRSMQRHLEAESKANAVMDDCAMQYYLERCRATSIEPAILATRENRNRVTA